MKYGTFKPGSGSRAAARIIPPTKNPPREISQFSQIFLKSVPGQKRTEMAITENNKIHFPARPRRLAQLGATFTEFLPVWKSRAKCGGAITADHFTDYFPLRGCGFWPKLCATHSEERDRIGTN